MGDLDVDTSNDSIAKKIKDFKRVIIKSIDKFNSYIKLDIKKIDIEKKDTVKVYLEKINTKKIASNTMPKVIINQILN